MIRIERAIRQAARLQDRYLVRIELCGSERHEFSDHFRWEVAVPPECRDELVEMLERWKRRKDI